MSICRMPTAGRRGMCEWWFGIGGSGWMTHCILVDDPPYDPQYSVEHLAIKSQFGKWFFRGLVGSSLSQSG